MKMPSDKDAAVQALLSGLSWAKIKHGDYHEAWDPEGY